MSDFREAVVSINFSSPLLTVTAVEVNVSRFAPFVHTTVRCKNSLVIRKVIHILFSTFQ